MTLEDVFKIQETTLSEGHPDRLTSQFELARAYLENGQTQKAVQLLEQVVRIKETTRSEDLICPSDNPFQNNFIPA